MAPRRQIEQAPHSALLSRSWKLIKMTNLPGFNYKTRAWLTEKFKHLMETTHGHFCALRYGYNQLGNIGKDTNNAIRLIITRLMIINMPRNLNWRNRRARGNVPRPRAPQHGVNGHFFAPDTGKL